MNSQDLCMHTYSYLSANGVRCAVCSLLMGVVFPKLHTPAYEALRGTFETKKYKAWLEQSSTTVASTMTLLPPLRYEEL